MALAGGAFLALLNDFAPERDDEYNLWHSVEHVPERLTVPGITAARRYVARGAERYRYFTLYEMASPAVMLSAPYLHLFDHPTPWSTSMRPSFLNFRRMPCRTVHTRSEGVAGAIELLVFEGAVTDPEATWAKLAQTIAPLPGVIGVHVGLQDAALPGPPGVAGHRALEPATTWVMLIEAQETAWFERHAAALAGEIARIVPSVSTVLTQRYSLMHLITEGRRPSSF